jgi:Putative adhesin
VSKRSWVLVLAVAAYPGLVRSAGAEVSKTVRLTQDASLPFAVENLAGTMTVLPGTGSQAEVTATLYAESPALLEAMRFEPARDDEGRPSLRVRYPASERHFRYSGSGGRSETRYDGRRVKVSRDSGVVVYADLEVRLPPDVAGAWVRNAVGPLSASGVSGEITLDTGSGAITLSDVSGTIVADTGSGNVEASNARGRFTCDTGSGNCAVTGFRGELLSLDTGSGSLDISEVETIRLKADTGSGRVRVSRGQAEQVVADTGSGSVDLDLGGSGLRRVKADTGSGDVRLRLPEDAAFEVRVNTGGGELESRFADAQPIVEDDEVVGYRRGAARIKIDVDTGSGDVVVEPVR